MKNVEIYDLKSNKFKTKTVNIYLYDELSRETASLNALVLSVLKRGTVLYPTFRDIVIRGQELYDTKIYAEVEKKGELQILNLSATVVDEKYIKDMPDIFQHAADLLYEVFTNPILENNCFKREYVEQEKINLIDAIESKINDKAYYASQRCLQNMCSDELYSVDEDGDKEIIESVTPESLYEYYKNVFLKQLPMKIFVTGDVNDTHISYIKNNFDKISRSNIKSIVSTGSILPKKGEIRKVTERANIIQAKLCIGFRTNISADFEDYYSMSICNLIFGGGIQSKLFQNVREKESMAYYIYSRIDKFKGIMIVSGGIESENKEKVTQMTLDHLEDIKNEKISDIEFDSALNSYIDAIKQLQDGQRTLSDFYLGQMLSGTTMNLDEIINKVRNVTKQSVASVAKRIQTDTVYYLLPEEGQNNG